MSYVNKELGIEVTTFTRAEPTEKANSGALNIEAVAEDKSPLEYSIDAGESFQEKGDFEGLNPGEYDVRIRYTRDPKKEWLFGIADLSVPISNESCSTPKGQCGTLLFPGDLTFTALDNNIFFGDDRVSVTTLVPLKPYTKFLVTNAVFEAGADAKERTKKWYDGDGKGSSKLASQEITYIGNNILPGGTVICFDLPTWANPLLAKNFKINGIQSNEFCVKDVGNAATPRIDISTSQADAIFLMQGTWTFDETCGMLCGRVLSGFMTGGSWYEFEEAVPEETRRSRRPVEIDCMAIQGLTSPASFGAFFKPNFSSYTPFGFLSESTVYENWVTNPGTYKVDLPKDVCRQKVWITGSTGPTGPTGPTGSTGSTGATGSTEKPKEEETAKEEETTKRSVKAGPRGLGKTKKRKRKK